MLSRTASKLTFLNKKTTISTTCKRFLNLHEYQSKGLMQQHGIAVQQFHVAADIPAAERIAKDFKQEEYVIKAQVLAGGRGKGVFDTGFKGGVHLTKKCDEIVGLVAEMLGNKLVTKQTPVEGVPVNMVMVAEAMDISRETYIAIVMDRESGGPMVVCSPCGGVDIEEVAHNQPHKIFKEQIDIKKGITKEQALRLAECLEFKGKLKEEASEQIIKLYELFCKVDAIQIEINPFGETPKGEVICFDAKINFDDNAKYRQEHIFQQADHGESDPREVEASNNNLNYIGLDGNVGCLVNGAGLAMATMDIIKLHGGEAANFLDVGGGVNEHQISAAFKILGADVRVKSILVNIFGGIVDCAIVARGLVGALKNNPDFSIPIVVRLEGTNVEEAKRILTSSAVNITTAANLDEASLQAINLTK